MSLLDQSTWWLVPYIVLMFVMLHAIMEFTVTLLARRPPPTHPPVPAQKLRQRLFTLSHPDQPHPLLPGDDCDLVIRWESVHHPPTGRFIIGGGGSRDTVRFLLDERRHELRMHHVGRVHGFFLGLDGWFPRLRGYASLAAGPPGGAITQPIADLALRSGWSIRPVLWWFQATRSGYLFLEAITPPPFRRWSARRFWGLLAPLSYALGMGYLLIVIGPLDSHNLRVLLLVSFIWWGAWGFLAWVLAGLPTLRRRPRR